MGATVLLSHGDGTDESVALSDGPVGRVRSDELLWIDAERPDSDERALIARILDLPESALCEIDERSGDPDARVLEHGVIVTLQAFAEPAPAALPVLHILVGPSWVLTWHTEPVDFLQASQERVKDMRQVGRLTPVQFLVALMHRHLDSFFVAAEELEREIDELDDLALQGEEENLLKQLVAMRRRLARGRRVLSAHREVYSELTRPDFLAQATEPEHGSLDGLTHRLERARDAMTNAREMLLGTFDVHMTRTAQRTNEIMRLLTWVTVILLPAGVVAGVMGMNFQVDFFDNPAMFWLVIATMVLVAVITLLFARWRRLL